MHDSKIGIIVREDLLDWQKLNVTAFLASGIAAGEPTCIGESYEDGSGNQYVPLFRQPVWVFVSSAEQLQRTRIRAQSRNVPLAIYTAGMFVTDNDADNRAVVKVVSADALDIVGLALRTDRKAFDKIIDGLKRHP